jgi:outer membrane protein OmpA-like peptidoglycan-associated protein
MSLGQSLLDPTLARPIKVFVDKADGRVWRLIDPLSPTENMPVVKEWTEERKKKRVIEGEITEYYEQEEYTEQTPRTRIIDLLCTVEDAHHAFDQSTAIVDPGDLQRIGQALRDNPNAKVLIFAHCDRVHQSGYDQAIRRDTGVLVPTDLNRGYNHRLSNERASVVRRTYLSENTNIANRGEYASDGAKCRRVGCSNYNPIDGPNPAERESRSPGNAVNRRTDLLVLPNPDQFDRYVQQDAKMQALHQDVTARGGVWASGASFPCRMGNVQICNLLSTTRGTSGRDEPYMGSNGQPTCRYYERLIQWIGTEVEVDDGTDEQSGTRKVKKVRKEKDRVVEETEVVGSYEPPEGEHYGFNFRELLKSNITPGLAVAPEVAVAPNREEDETDYNLIKPGPIRVVKMDIGFWGDERKRDSSRDAGFHRKPARWFGAIEGPFVFLCFFETRESADRPDSFAPKMPEAVDEDLNPLMFRFCRKAIDLGFSVRVEKKAVGEAGPDGSELNLFFPDFHLPRKFDEKDAEFETEDKCVQAVQMVKAMLLDSLRKDYLLSGKRTPWLSAHDRLKCLEFFEHGAEKLKLPMYSSGRTMSNPFSPEGDSFMEQLGDVAQKSIQAIQQVGYYMFEFTRDDLRREVTRFGGMYRDKGRGFTKDALANWFYGFETDRQLFEGPPPSGPDYGSLIPGPIREITDRLGVTEGPQAGRAPANLNSTIDPGPARDLLRLFKVVRETNDEHGPHINIFHTGDMYEMWINRRYLYLDLAETDDPASQRPSLIDMMDFGESGGAAGVLSGGIKWTFRTLLSGVNAQEFDVWHRREGKKDAAFPTGLSEAEDTASLDMDRPIVGTASGGGPSGGGLTLPGASVTSPLDQKREGPLPLDRLRGRGYISSETSERMRQVEAFEAPIKTAEDRELLGNNGRGDAGLWNKAIVDAFRDARSTQLYGNHDCYRGIGGGNAPGYESRRQLWVEHGQRFEDSNIDGQVLGAAVTNMVYDILEVPLYEGLLDEFYLHREQDQYQPGIAQWFIVSEFGQREIAEQQAQRGTRERVEKFRIAVTGHTHAADLVVLEYIFSPKEKTSLGAITTAGAIAKLLASLIGKIIEWYNKYKDREESWKDWWNETMQPSVDKAGEVLGRPVDKLEALGAGLGQCLNQADDFLKKHTTDKLLDEWGRTKDVAKQNVDAVKNYVDEQVNRGRQAADQARDTFGF